MTPAPPQTVVVTANDSKPESRGRLQELLDLLAAAPVEVVLDDRAAALAGRSAGASLEDLGPRADLVIVLGGDGTLLRAVRQLGDATPPVLGINLGHLGFLTGVSCDSIAEKLPPILAGQFRLSERHMLETFLVRQGERVAIHPALNDAVIARGAFTRVVRLEVHLDGELLTEYICDGMIFASATGSTAYSLSAGGPILLPTTRAFVITPICPHALSDRSVIAGRNAVARCRVTDAAGELLLTVDGQTQLGLEVGDEIEVRRAPRTVKMALPEDLNFFDLLRQKLKWSGSNV